MSDPKEKSPLQELISEVEYAIEGLKRECFCESPPDPVPADDRCPCCYYRKGLYSSLQKIGKMVVPVP